MKQIPLIAVSVLVLVMAAFMIKVPPQKGPPLHVIGVTQRAVEGTNYTVIHVGIYTNNQPIEIFTFGAPIKKP